MTKSEPKNIRKISAIFASIGATLIGIATVAAPIFREGSDWPSCFGARGICVLDALFSIKDAKQYQNLKDLLSSENFKQADQETRKLLEVIVPLDIRPYSKTSYSCPDLRIIDKLWSDYSNNKFGLRKQKKLFLDELDRQPILFLNKVGWLKEGRDPTDLSAYTTYEDLTFDGSKAVPGHLPYLLNSQLQNSKTPCFIVSFNGRNLMFCPSLDVLESKCL